MDTTTNQHHRRGRLLLERGDQQRAAEGEQHQDQDEAGGGHGSGLLAGRLLARFGLLRTAPERRLHAVGDPRRQLVGPLVYRLVGHANSLGGGGDGSAEEFNGFGFAHSPLNHSSSISATSVQTLIQLERYRHTMVEKERSRSPYAERLAQAMSQSENPMGTVELAEALGITRQAVDKLLKGGSNEMSASNNARAARLLNVDPTWLATGEGTAQPAEFVVRWHERRLIELFRKLPPDEQDEFAGSVESRCAIHEQHFESKQQKPHEQTRGKLVSDSAAPAARAHKVVRK